MGASERRMDERVNIHVPLSFRELNDPNSAGQYAESENISRRGIYFETGFPLQVGELLEVSMRMPRGLAWKASSEVSCVARVVHIRTKAFSGSKRGIGLYIERYEAKASVGERWAN